MRSKSSRIDRGFTLIEITMVIVVIGLGIGGIFVGKDLIRAAEIRSQISQIEQLTAAVNTFKLKYNALPGDISPRETAQLGFFTFTGARAGQPYLPYYNTSLGYIRYGYGDNSGDIQLGERYVFWQHLSEAKLITGQYGGSVSSGKYIEANTASYLAAGNPVGAPAPELFIPQAKIGTGGFQVMANLMYTKYKFIPDISSPNLFNIVNISVIQAFTIDSKIDDGVSQAGKIRAYGLTVEDCLSDTSPYDYDLITFADKTDNCAVFISW